MRVTLLAQFFPPESFAGANRIRALAAALGREADVTVVAPRPSYPHPSLYADMAEPAPPAGVRLLRAGTCVPHGRSLAGRAVAEQRLAARLARAGIGARADVVVASSPAMFLGPAGLALARLERVPFVWDVRDLTWEYAREVATAPAARRAADLLARLLWSVAERADLLVAATPGIARLLGERRLRGRVLLVPNGVDPGLLERFDPLPHAPSARPSVTYVGLVGRPQALGVLCDVAARLPHVVFNVVGEGPELPALAEDVARRRLANLRLHGYLPPGRLAAVYRESDVLFGQLHASGLHAATALPSKLLEYMAAGRPIVYAGEGLAEETLRRAGCGLAVAPGDADAIADAVATLLRDPETARALGAAGRRHVERRASREEEMAALVPELRRLVQRRSRLPVAA